MTFEMIFVLCTWSHQSSCNWTKEMRSPKINLYATLICGFKNVYCAKKRDKGKHWELVVTLNENHQINSRCEIHVWICPFNSLTWHYKICNIQLKCFKVVLFVFKEVVTRINFPSYPVLILLYESSAISKLRIVKSWAHL